MSQHGIDSDLFKPSSQLLLIPTWCIFHIAELHSAELHNCKGFCVILDRAIIDQQGIYCITKAHTELQNNVTAHVGELESFITHDHKVE